MGKTNEFDGMTDDELDDELRRQDLDDFVAGYPAHLKEQAKACGLAIEEARQRAGVALDTLPKDADPSEALTALGQVGKAKKDTLESHPDCKDLPAPTLKPRGGMSI